MTKDEALAKLASFMEDSDRRSIELRDKALPIYAGELHRAKADVYRIAISIVRKITEGDAQ